MEESAKQQFSVYHCDIQGSGASTRRARWDFRKNPHTLQGLGRNQSLTFLLPEAPHFAFQASMSARIVRGGLNGVIESARSLISGPNVAFYAVEVDYPPPQPRGLHDLSSGERQRGTSRTISALSLSYSVLFDICFRRNSRATIAFPNCWGVHSACFRPPSAGCAAGIEFVLLNPPLVSSVKSVPIANNPTNNSFQRVNLLKASA